MKTIKTIAVTVALLVPLLNVSNVHAERSVKQMLEECFWGLLFEDEEDRQLSLALNIVSGGLGSYAVTSGTLSPDSLCASKKVASLMFITETYASLVEETVKGEGENLTVALNMAGCDLSSHSSAVNNMRSRMPAILRAAPADTASVEGVSSYYDNLQAVASQSCKV